MGLCAGVAGGCLQENGVLYDKSIWHLRLHPLNENGSTVEGSYRRSRELLRNWTRDQEGERERERERVGKLNKLLRDDTYCHPLWLLMLSYREQIPCCCLLRPAHNNNNNNNNNTTIIITLKIMVLKQLIIIYTYIYLVSAYPEGVFSAWQQSSDNEALGTAGEEDFSQHLIVAHVKSVAAHRTKEEGDVWSHP